MEKLLDLRKVITSNIAYLKSLPSKAQFVITLTNLMRIPIFEADRMIETFEREITKDRESFDNWVNLIFQIETELTNRDSSLASFADLFNLVIVKQVPGGEGIVHRVNPSNVPQTLILAIRIYMDVPDKDALEGAENE